MRILHTSDIHLDSPLTTHLSSDKVRERKRELISTFRRIVSDASIGGAEVIIIAGDLFDSEKVGVRTLTEIMAIFEGNPDITFLYLTGNHEGDRLSETFHTMPKNLLVFGEEWTEFRISGVNFYGRTTTEPKMFSALELDKNETNVVVLHGELRDKSDTGGVIGRNEARDIGIDYLALGHYHKYTEEWLSDRTLAVYSGTPEGRGFDEAWPCGYSLVTLRGGETSAQFIKSSERELHIVKVQVTELSGILEIESALREALSGIPFQDLVRVLLVGYAKPEEKPDLPAIEAAFRDRYYYFEVKDETRLGISIDDYKYDKSLKGEFIRLVLSEENISLEDKERIITTGLAALMGEV